MVSHKTVFSSLFLEESFGVQTVIVPVDFNDGPSAYEKIRPHIENREIGILGQY
jgi:hypothetical protein